MKQTKISTLVPAIRMLGLSNRIRETFVPFTSPEILNAIHESFSKAGITVSDMRNIIIGLQEQPIPRNVMLKKAMAGMFFLRRRLSIILPVKCSI